MVSTSGQVIQSGLVVAPYGRAQENQADLIGQGLAAKSGYDPAGLAHFLYAYVEVLLALLREILPCSHGAGGVRKLRLPNSGLRWRLVSSLTHY